MRSNSQIIFSTMCRSITCVVSFDKILGNCMASKHFKDERFAIIYNFVWRACTKAHFGSFFSQTIRSDCFDLMLFCDKIFCIYEAKWRRCSVQFSHIFFSSKVELPFAAHIIFFICQKCLSLNAPHVDYCYVNGSVAEWLNDEWVRCCCPCEYCPERQPLTHHIHTWSYYNYVSILFISHRLKIIGCDLNCFNFFFLWFGKHSLLPM